ncbi:hypothetical protein Halha_1396 [Halobacteroides halobius DSM 5150]|uniref:MEDS domain-containing protein n=1 Tax=Halobacteroides halobius (strain ATCC 35273 / DSM 5150 / MD-1) TaxID=748449 RepID=L0K8L5_HALHC|nr:MEDS domain-containing protein [Halobacteroides halobius]AGB41341.1 hypothetical protein Halha_1396 [Halobacteroides halobius DSM 5150]
MKGINYNGHLCSLYYGEEHFLVKAISFLEAGIKHQEQCLCYLEPGLISQIKSYFENIELNEDQLRFKSLEPIIEDAIKTKNLDSLAKRLINLQQETISSGHSDIRFLVQAKVAIEETSPNKFLTWKSRLAKALSKADLKWLSMYDIADLISEQEVSKAALQELVSKHSSLLSAGKVHNLSGKEIV